MLSGLMLTAFLMGAGGMAHCAAMCGTACAAAFPRGVPLLALLGRCVGYTALGAVAALSAGLVAQWGRQAAILQPFWLLAQAAAVVMGCWLLFTGRVPAVLDQWGQGAYWRLRGRVRRAVGDHPASRWRPWWPLLAGVAWAALPCGLLYAALMVAALASTPWGGGLVMLSFALPSAVGVWAAPALLARLSRRGEPAQPALSTPAVVPVLWLQRVDAPSQNGSSADMARYAPGPTLAGLPRNQGLLIDPKWAVRTSGLCLGGMAAWGLAHNLLDQWRAWCA